MFEPLFIDGENSEGVIRVSHHKIPAGIFHEINGLLLVFDFLLLCLLRVVICIKIQDIFNIKSALHHKPGKYVPITGNTQTGLYRWR